MRASARLRKAHSMETSSSSASGCGCAVLAFNLAFGGWLFDFCLWNIVGKDVPWYADVLAGLVCGQFAFPCAVVVWIVKLCGVPTPFVH